MKIGIMGAPVNNSNHGCMALLYSLISIFKEIENEQNDEFEYVIFDWKYNEESIDMLSKVIGVEKNKISFAPYVMLRDPVRFVYHFMDYIKMKHAIKKCDFIIDATEGDSFSDIYGDTWFSGRTKVKLLVEKSGVPLILAPQTYGPYLKEENRQLAIESIKGAKYVLTRDKQSREFIKEAAGIDAVYTTDLAFALPVKEYPVEKTDKIKIGINASGLLFESGEMKERKFEISVDYEQYLISVLDKIFEKDIYEVYFISHVDGDINVHRKLNEKFPRTRVVPNFKNPVEAKSCISQMDIFIGARMHGTIAAFTQDVACIPTSYSPKFENLFKSVGYDVLVDLTKLSTDEAVDKTMEYIESYKTIKNNIQHLLGEYSDVITSSKKYLKQYIYNL